VTGRTGCWPSCALTFGLIWADGGYADRLLMVGDVAPFDLLAPGQ